MSIVGFQIILLFFALFMLYVIFLHWKRKEIAGLAFFIWLLIWGGFIYFTLFPRTLEPLSKELYTVRVLDLATIIAFMILTYITIENNIKLKDLEKKIEKLIRELTLKNLKK